MSTQQTQIRSRVAAALSSTDTIVTVTGAAGCGKSMLVYSALENLQITPVIAKIARMQLGPDEVLELLLSELGVDRQLTGTIAHYAEFKRLVQEFEEKDTHLFIVVEDAQRLGMDALGELESLTSAGDSTASIVLMGPPELNELLSRPELARIKHRTRLNIAVEAFNASETRDYLAHRVTLGSGKLENVFDDNAVELVYRYSGGIRRVIDTLCEAALNAAATANTKPVSSNLIQQTASRELGLDLDSVPSIQPAASRTDPEVPQPSSSCLAPELPEAHEGLHVSAAEESDEIPHLIQDTLPGVEALPGPVIEETAKANKPIPEMDPDTGTRPMRTITAMIEPVAPEPLIRTNVDEKALKQLDDALRPDTQLLRTLEEPPAPVEDLAPVPIGLQDEINNSPKPEAAAPGAPASPTAPPAAPVASDTPTGDIESSPDTTKTNIPTLSTSMRFTAPEPAQDATVESGDTQTIRRPNFAAQEDEQQPPKSATTLELAKPNIAALESAMATARKGPVDLETGVESIADAKPAVPDEAEMAVKAKPAANTTETATPEPMATTADAAIPDDSKLSAANSLPEIILDTSLEKRKNEAEAKLQELKPTPAPDELESGKNEESAAEATAAANDANDEAADKQQVLERAKIDKLASDLGNAKSLEEIDDFAAETLFGAEFNEAAAAVTAMAAANSASDPVLQLEDVPDEAVVAASEAEIPGDISSKADEVPGQNKSAAMAPPKPDVESSSVRRCAMVRAMNSIAPGTPAPSAPRAAPKPAAPATTPTPPNPGVVAASPRKNPRKETGNGEDQDSQFESIENQFGSGMTKTLKALSAVEPVSQADPDDDEKKRKPFLSRFKRS